MTPNDQICRAQECDSTDAKHKFTQLALACLESIVDPFHLMEFVAHSLAPGELMPSGAQHVRLAAEQPNERITLPNTPLSDHRQISIGEQISVPVEALEKGRDRQRGDVFLETRFWPIIASNRH